MKSIDQIWFLNAAIANFSGRSRFTLRLGFIRKFKHSSHGISPKSRTLDNGLALFYH